MFAYTFSNNLLSKSNSFWALPANFIAFLNYREYVISEGGYIEDDLLTALAFCQGIPEYRVRALLYKDYVESQGGYIEDLNTLKETFKNITES